MKTTIKLLLFLTTVLTFAACSKDDEKVRHEREIVYTVDNKTTTVQLTTDSEWDDLLDRFCDYAENDSKVSFYNAKSNTPKNTTKNVITFSTTSRAEMISWMRRMEEAGKTVTVTFDSGTGTYNGIAYSSAPQPQYDYWVDLGLPSGLLWAKCNVGAINPEDTGYYFAWGETWPKTDYSWDTYTYCYGGDDHSFTKYCHFEYVGYNGYTDTLTVLEPSDDAATVNIGGGARTPTYYEWSELRDNCTIEWVTQNGKNGLRCTGPNGNSIFLPEAGHFSGNGVGVWGFYWTANIAIDIPCPGDIITTGACSFEVDDDGLKLFRSNRFIGMQVRPVRSAN